MDRERERSFIIHHRVSFSVAQLTRKRKGNRHDRMSNAHDWWSFSTAAAATHSDNMVVVVVGWLERERAISPNCSRRKTRPPLGDRTTSPKWWIVAFFFSILCDGSSVSPCTSHTQREKKKRMYVGAVIGIDRAAASALICSSEKWI